MITPVSDPTVPIALTYTGIPTSLPEGQLYADNATDYLRMWFEGALRPVAYIGASFNHICNGRLTTESGVAVSTSDRTSQGTLYFTPYQGSLVSLYDGTNWVLRTFTQLSLSLSVSSGSVYDIFLYDNSGTLTLEATAWTSTTARNTAVVLQDGVYVKSGATSRRYLGTIYASGSNVTEDSANLRGVWNAQNRIMRPLKKAETTGSWVYNTATWRSLNNSTANRVQIVQGLALEQVRLQSHVGVICDTAGNYGVVGIALDRTNGNDADMVALGYAGVANVWNHTFSFIIAVPAIGYHYYQATEYSSSSGTVTFFSQDPSSDFQRRGGLLGSWMC